MRKFIIALLLLVAMASPFVVAEGVQPTQQFNKIYLSPFYRQSLTSAQPYNYTLTVNPPDGVTSITSAIISFNAQINGQTQNFTLKVNNRSCNNPDYYIATAFSTTGQAPFYFDCTNVINQAGNYNITLTSSVNTGAVQGWVEMTYMNRPLGKMDVSGTEYSPNDPSTVFVQLKDSQGLPVNNGACYVDIRYPNATHPYMIEDAPMLTPANNDDGLYYYDLTAPSMLGVYMVTAKCSYSYNLVWFFGAGDVRKCVATNLGGGSISGDTVSLNDPSDNLYFTSTANAGGNSVVGFNFTNITGVSNITNINLYFSGRTTNSGTFTFAYLNSTGSYVNLANTITTNNQADSFQSNSVPIGAIVNDRVMIRVSGTGMGNGGQLLTNWLSLSLLANSGTVQEVKGSSELHITNIANATMTSFSNTTVIVNNSAIASAIWNTTARTLTASSSSFIGGTEYSTTETEGKVVVRMTDNAGEPVSGASCTLNVFFNQSILFNKTMIEYNCTPVGVYYTNFTLSGIAGVYPYAVDCVKAGKSYYMVSSYHIFGNSPSVIADAVWNATNRNLTYYQNFSSPQVDLTNYSRISNLTASDVWSFANRNLTYYPSVDTSAIASAVWNYSVRNLTYYPVQVDLTNYSLISQNVWNYASRYITGEII